MGSQASYNLGLCGDATEMENIPFSSAPHRKHRLYIKSGCQKTVHGNKKSSFNPITAENRNYIYGSV